MTTVMINRKALREALATLLSAQLVGVGKPVEAVYSYQVADFQGKSPILFVTSAGSWRRNPEHSARITSIAYLDVNVFVLYSDGGSWTEQKSEERLDLIEQKVAEVVVNNARPDGGLWLDLDFVGRTQVTSVVIGGKDYSWEVIPLSAVLWGA